MATTMNPKGWIKVEKALPPVTHCQSFTDDVLVRCRRHPHAGGWRYDVAMYDHAEDAWYNDDETRLYVSHWMPIVGPSLD